MPKRKPPEPEKLPRFALTLTDLNTSVQVSVGTDDLRDFWKPIQRKHWTPGADNSCEITRVFSAFAKDVASRDTAWEGYNKAVAESEKAMKRGPDGRFAK